MKEHIWEMSYVATQVLRCQQAHQVSPQFKTIHKVDLELVLCLIIKIEQEMNSGLIDRSTIAYQWF